MEKSKEELALEAYLAGLTEKKAKVSDNRLIAIRTRLDNPEFVQTHLNAIHKSSASEGWLKATRENARRRSKDPVWLQNNANKNKRIAILKYKPIVTPFGVFKSKKDSVSFYNEKNNVTNGNDSISYKIKKYPEQYYYITQEEYIMLTGKDPFNE
jgi:hypothetical protein